MLLACYAVPQAAVQVGKMGRHFIGVVKTGHGLFPKAFLKSHLTSAPAGSRVALSAIVDGVDLMAVGYKYNMRKVLFLVATAGASPLEDGNPYIQRWADDFGNTVTRSIPRPYVLSNYFERSPRVDNHNQSRQHDLALEEAWNTQDCWFRLATTLCGIVTTDCWKITKFHVPYAHPYASMTIKDFSELMAKALIYNGLDGDLAPSRPPGHRLAIAPKRYLASPTASTPLATTGDTRTAAASSQGAAVATVTRARSNGARATACSATSPCACPARCTAGTAGSTISTATRPPSAA